MRKKICYAGLLCILGLMASSLASGKEQLRVGAAAITITPFGQNADWDGGVTETGVWGEKFVDEPQWPVGPGRTLRR